VLKIFISIPHSQKIGIANGNGGSFFEFSPGAGGKSLTQSIALRLESLSFGLVDVKLVS